MKNPVVKKIALVFFMLMFIAVFFVMSIIDLTNTKDRREIVVTEACDLLVVENSINGLIPTGKDYYYLGFSTEDYKMYMIHAGKNWLKDNFDEKGFSLSSEGVTVKGLAKRVSEFEIQRELEDRISTVEGIASGLDYGYVLELNYIRDSILKIIAGICVCIMLAIAGYCKKTGKEVNSKTTTVLLGAAIIAVLIFALITIV